MKSDKTFYKEKYEEILFDIKQKGIRVYHRKTPNLVGGLYHPDSGTITINKIYKYTLDGCYYLCHERIHQLQQRYNEYPLFFKMKNNEKFSEEKFRVVIAAEKDAAFRAQKTLKIYGIKYEPDELNPELEEQMYAYWRDTYFID